MYIAHKYPGPCLFIFPTVELAERHSKKKFAPSLRDTPAMKDVFGDPSRKSSGNTLLLKEFPGGSISFSGANSGASFRSVSIRYLMADDLDEFPDDVDGQGDPLVLAMKRTDSLFKQWRLEGMKKVVLKVADQKDLLEFKTEADRAGLINALITDAGHTELPPGTKTVLAIGPDEEGKIDKLTGHLKAY